MNRADVVREYRTKFPDYPNLKLARIIYNKEKLLFTSVDAVRTILRKIEGNSGSTFNQIKPTHKRPPRPLNPYKLPESDEIEYKPYILPKGHKRVAIFADLHIPYHSMQAITAALDFCKKQKPDALIINGDALDFHKFSRFNQDPRKKHFAEELEVWQQMFDVFDKVLGCKIYYKLGNHEDRYEHYLWMKAGELVGVEEFKLANILKARARGIEVIESNKFIKAGKLNILHGHEFGRGMYSPVNPARSLYLKGKVSAIQGDSHQVSEHTEPNMNGDIVTTWSAGCLCSLSPEYLPINKWAHGFAIVDFEKGGDFHLTNKRIYKGRVL